MKIRREFLAAMAGVFTALSVFGVGAYAVYQMPEHQEAVTVSFSDSPGIEAKATLVSTSTSTAKYQSVTVGEESDRPKVAVNGEGGLITSTELQRRLDQLSFVPYGRNLMDDGRWGWVSKDLASGNVSAYTQSYREYTFRLDGTYTQQGYSGGKPIKSEGYYCKAGRADELLLMVEMAQWQGEQLVLIEQPVVQTYVMRTIANRGHGYNYFRSYSGSDVWFCGVQWRPKAYNGAGRYEDNRGEPFEAFNF